MQYLVIGGGFYVGLGFFFHSTRSASSNIWKLCWWQSPTQTQIATTTITNLIWCRTVHKVPGHPGGFFSSRLCWLKGATFSCGCWAADGADKLHIWAAPCSWLQPPTAGVCPGTSQFGGLSQEEPPLATPMIPISSCTGKCRAWNAEHCRECWGLVQEIGQAWDVENWVLKREISAHRTCGDAEMDFPSLSPILKWNREEGRSQAPALFSPHPTTPTADSSTASNQKLSFQ